MEFGGVEFNLHLLGTMLVTLVWLVEGWHPFFKRGGSRLFHDSGNLIIGLFNFGFIGVMFMPLISRVSEGAENQGFGLLNILHLPPWLEIVCAILLFDLWMYLWHRMNHETPILWRFHRFHHADKEMNTTTSFRFHTLELLISSVLKLGVIPFLGMNLLEFVVYEAILFPVIAFHHSNIAIPKKLDDVLRWVIASPNMHKVHHSNINEETDSNYGSIFSWWDRWFGTSRYREDVDRIVYGVSRS